MEINPFVLKNYLEVARSRKTMAFENKPTFDRVLEFLHTPFNELQEVLRQLMQERSIDTAVGRQLDIIGDIVGQPRELLDVDMLPYFGFELAPSAESFGDINHREVGGYWWSIGQALGGNVLLEDSVYRVFIKAKIIKNLSRATPEDTIEFLKFVFGVNLVSISLDRFAEALIMLGDSLNQFEENLLKYFSETTYKSYFTPKSLGVKINYGKIPSDGFFAFMGVPSARGYGDLKITTDNAYVDYVNQEYVRDEEHRELIGGGRYASIL